MSATNASLSVGLAIVLVVVGFFGVGQYSYAQGRAEAWTQAVACMNFVAAQRPYQAVCAPANGGNVWGPANHLVGAGIGR